MFKIITLLTLCFGLSACAYNYRIGVPEHLADSELTTIRASFAFDISEIDSVKFKEKFNYSAEGINTITLSPGYHSIKFRYCDCSLNGGVYTQEDSFVDGVFEKGKHYEIRGEADSNRMRFYIREIAELKKPAAKT